MTDEPTWDEATKGNSKFVKFPAEEMVKLTITNARLERNPPDAKVGPNLIAFKADVTEENGEACEKLMDVSSKRLKDKLRPIFEGKARDAVVKLSIMKVGEKYETQWSVKEEK